MAVNKRAIPLPKQYKDKPNINNKVLREKVNEDLKEEPKKIELEEETIRFHLLFWLTLLFDKKGNKEVKIMEVKNKPKRQIIREILNGKYTEEDIAEYMQKNGIDDIGNKLSETIYLYLNNTKEQTAEILNVSAECITKRINKFIKCALRK